MISLEIIPYSGFKYLIRCSDSFVLDEIKEYLMTKDEVVFRKKSGVLERRITNSKLYLFKKRTDFILINAGLISFISLKIGIIVRRYGDQINFRMTPIGAPDLLMIDKWRDIFPGHPRGPKHGEEQVNAFNVLTKSFEGIAELYTG